MCNDCCGCIFRWCKSFTKTELLLIIIECVIIIIFIGFLFFLILHLVACADSKRIVIDKPITDKPITDYIVDVDIVNQTTKSEEQSVWSTKVEKEKNESTTVPSTVISQCTWVPSKKTNALTHYFEATSPAMSVLAQQSNVKTISKDEDRDSDIYSTTDSDGEEVDDELSLILALVKLSNKKSTIQVLRFGCITTVIGRFWVLTSASCLDEIQKNDSLESYVLMQNYGKKSGRRIFSILEIKIHPGHLESNGSFDVAALKTEAALPFVSGKEIIVASVLDYLLIMLGEKLTVLGYGKFRSAERRGAELSVRAASVYVVGEEGRRGRRTRRHLRPRGGVRRGARADAAAVRAGPLASRGTRCSLRAGEPLLRGRVLLALLPRPPPACEPARYAAVAAAGGWLRSLS